MKKYVNGEYIEMTTEEIAEMQTQQEEEKKQYWQSLSYEEAVNLKIRQRYTESEEFAILRQKEEKPGEFAEYYDYCEECKGIVRKLQEESE